MYSRAPRFSLSSTRIATITTLALMTSITPAMAQSWIAVGPSPTIVPPESGLSTNAIGMGDNPVSGAMRAVLPSPTNPNILFAAAVNGGIWQTLDGGINWKPIGDDLPSLSIGAMAFDQNDPTRLWVGFGKQSSYGAAGSQTGIVSFDTNTGLWSTPVSADLVGKDISRIIANGNNIVVGIKTSDGAPGVWRSTNGGQTFTNATDAVQSLPNGNITSLAGDPNNANRYYAAVVTDGNPKGVYRSDDGGFSWTNLSSLPISQAGTADGRITHDIMLSVAKDGTLVASVIDPVKSADGLIKANPQVIVYRSSNQGQTWISMGSATSTEHLPDGNTVQWGIYSSGQFNMHGALLVDPNDSTVVYISGDAQGPPELIGNGKPTSLGASTYSGRLFRGKFNPVTGETVWEAITDGFTANGSGPHADSRFMMIDAAGNLLQSDDGGIYLRTNPQSREGIWQSLNGNLQTGEIHDARWNSLNHTIVTAMQDNGATIQIQAGNPTHAVASSGDGGIAAVNSHWQLNGERYAAAYVSSQHLGGPRRYRLEADGSLAAVTNLELGVERDGIFVPFSEGTGAIKPPRPKKPVTKGQALDAQTQTGVEIVPFYPAFTLNSIDASRLAVGGYDLYIGQDSMDESDTEAVRITTRKLLDAARDSTGFISLAYGARNNIDALLGGTGDRSSLSSSGKLYYTPDVNSSTPTAIFTSASAGIQAALFDRDVGTDRIYFSDGFNIVRGAAKNDGSYDSGDFGNINGNLPVTFNERRGLDHIFNNDVSALVAAGTHNVAGGNWLYTLRGPANATLFNWDTRLGKIPNSQVFGLDYSVEDDVLLAYTMGRGAFALTDVTTYFPEATRLIFGQANNNSQPINAQLTDGARLDDNSPFSRPLVKVGAGTLNLVGTTAAYSGGTWLNGGLTLVNADDNLGASHAGVSFDSGTLRFASPFSMDRPITLLAGGGALDTGGWAIRQGNQPIDGSGQLTITGGGHYTLTINNSYAGGTFIAGATVAASKDSQLGAADGRLHFDAGRLDLLNDFILNESGKFTRRLTVNLGGGTLDTNNNDVPFAGSIDGDGALTLLGRPLRIAGDIRLNATWNGPMDVTAGNTLRGTGHINGPLTVRGTLYPGNSPGTMTVSGPVVQMPGSAFATDIDGTGTANGAGNYSRLLVLGPGNSYTAGGQIKPVLRGITGAASNAYTPPLGQGFTVVQADGGVRDSYSGLTQPAAGLLPGSRFDTVYRDQAIQLYVTPASYARLGDSGIATNSNQRRIGSTLENARPAAGVRAPADRKTLFDALAPVTASDLRFALDQTGGVGHAQLLWADLNNSKFLTSQLMDLVGARRSTGRSGEMPSLGSIGDSTAWAQALQRNSRLENDGLGYGYSDTLNGLMVGFERRLAPGAIAGIALGYVDSKAGITQRLGGGRLQNWQLMAYGSRERNDWFVEGTAGFGIGQNAARRNLALPGLNDTYRADLRSRNLALAGRTGWRLGQAEGPRLEGWLGLQYLASRHLDASERNGDSAGTLNISAGTLQSLTPSIGLGGSVPFAAAGIDWRASLRGQLNHEMLDNRPTMSASLLDSSMKIKGAATGRTSVNVSLGLSGQISQRLSFQADVSRESASHWQATTAGVSLRIAW